MSYRTRLKLVERHGRQQIMENSMCPLWSPCVRHRLHNQPLRLNLVSFWRDICLFFPCNRTPLNETSSSHFSVFSIRLPQVYFFFLLPFVHGWQFWATWVFQNLHGDRWFSYFLSFSAAGDSISSRLWWKTHVWSPRGPRCRRRRMNPAYSSWKSFPDVISGLDEGHSWAMVS